MLRLGRTFWITVITIIVEAVVAAANASGLLTAAEAAPIAASIAGVAATHNLGRAWEDGKRNAALSPFRPDKHQNHRSDTK